MKCLVFGGSGFIGYNLCERLINEGHFVKVVDRHISSSLLKFQDNKSFQFHSLDFVMVQDFSEILVDVDIIFHLISTTLPSTSSKDCIFDISSNVLSTLRLLNSSVKCGVKKIIFFSSGGTVYGVPKNIPINEEHATDPICSYGIQKLTIEKYLEFYNVQYGLDYNVVRLSNPYGKEQLGNNGQGVIPIFTRKIKEGKVIEIWGDGTITRDYIYIQDVIDAVMLLINYQGKYRIFNIGSGIGTNLVQLIETISKVIKIPYEICFLEKRKIDVPYNVLDINRAVNELRWHPSVSLEDGIGYMNY